METIEIVTSTREMADALGGLVLRGYRLVSCTWLEPLFAAPDSLGFARLGAWHCVLRMAEAAV